MKKKLAYLLTCLSLPLAFLFILLSLLARASAAPPTATPLPIRLDYGVMETHSLAAPAAAARDAPLTLAAEAALLVPKSSTALNPASASQQDDVAGEIISVVVDPTPVVAGEQAMFAVTVRNTGTTTWDPTGVEAEVIVVDEDGTQLATGWGADAVPFEAVAPGAETSIIAYLQVPRDWQGAYRYTVKLWYLSALVDSYPAEDALLEVSPAEGPIKAYEDDALQREGRLVGMSGGQAVDIVFAMDTSGSMYDEFSALCTKIGDVVIDLQSRGITVRYKILGINANRECTTDYVSNLIPGARSNHVEDWGPATYDLSYGYNWAPGYVRMIIPMSDEGPENGNSCYDPGSDRDAIADAIAAAQANDVRVSPVLGSWYQSSQAACITQLAEDLANGTGGRVFYSTDPSADLAAGIAELVAGAVPPSLRGDGTPPSEGPRYTVDDLAREVSWNDEVFYGWILPAEPTEQDLQQSYQFSGVIAIPIPITRYYGATLDPSNPSPLSPELRGKAVPDTVKLTIMAYDVDEYVRNPFAYAPDPLPPHEEDWIHVNGQPIDSYFVGQPYPEMLSGRNEEWVSHDYDIPVELLNFPARPPYGALKVATNVITIEVDHLNQGYATAVAWARLRIPGLRPTILVRGFDVGDYITPLGFLPLAGSIFDYWSDWFDYLGSGPPTGWLVREGFPNAVTSSHIDPENSDVLVRTEGTELYSENGPVIVNKVRDLLDGYGVNRVNLVGHSKGGIDIRGALDLEIGGGRSGKLGDYVDTMVTLGTPHEGIPIRLVRWVPFILDTVEEFTYHGMDQFNDQHDDPKGVRFVPLIGNQEDAGYAKFTTPFLDPSDSAIEIKSSTGCRRQGIFPDYYQTGFVRSDFEANHSEETSSESMFNEALRYLKPPELGGERLRQPDQPSPCASAQVALRLEQSNSTAMPQPIAMIMSTIASGAVHTHTLALEGESASVSLIWPYADAMGLTLTDPSGVPLDPSALPDTITYTQSLTDTKYVNYFIQAPQPGWWTAEITVTNPYTGGEPYMLVADAVSSLVLKTSTSQTLYSPGDAIVLTAVISDTGQPVTGATVSATVTVSDTLVTTLDLLDDGQHEDGGADDGVYGGVLTDTTHSGSYFFEVRAAGVSGSTSFTRLGYAQATIASGAARLLSYAEAAIDSDGDGLYNTLAITTSVETYAAGQYQVVGQLTNQSGTIIASASAFISGTAGTYPSMLSFDGQIIAQSGLDGPYQLRELYLIDRNLPTPIQADYRALAYTTASYSSSQFQRDPIILSSPVTDTGVDSNANGFYELLRVNTPLNVRHAGVYTVTVTLADGNGQGITGFTWPYTLTAGLNALALDFNGPSINLYNVDGPYQVKNFLISRTSTETLEVIDLHTTQPYSYTAFEADTVAPTSTIDPLPAVITTTPVINVPWSGSDPEPSSGIAFYDVQYKAGSTGTWTDWLTQTVLTGYPFGPTDPITVTSGETYYFQVRAADYAGNQEAYPGGDGDAYTTMLGVDLQVDKSALTDFIQEHTADYSINYRNDGPVAANNVVLTDTLPSGLSYVADTSGITSTVSGNTVVWSLGTVPAYANRSFNLTTYVSPTLAGGSLITNTLDISTPDQESDYTNNSAVAGTTVITATRDMRVSKDFYSGLLRPGQEIQYRIRYWNDGDGTASDVVITDTLPISTTYVLDYNSAGFTTVITDSTVVWTKPSVPSGESDYLYLTVRISDTVTTGEFLTNTVTISTSDEETDYSDNIYTDTQTVAPPSVDLYVRKSLTGGSVTPASDVTYEIYYRNYGDDPAEDVVITDSLPSLMRYVSHSGAFTPTVWGNQVIWDLGMVPGEPDDGYYGYLYLTAHISDTTPVGTVLTNTVEISTSTTETGTYSNSDTDVRTVIAPIPNLKVWKTGWDNLPRGSEATYQIHYQNYSWSPAPMTVLTDVLPEGLSFVSSSGHFTPTVSGNQIVWSLGTVPFWDVPGFDVTLDLTVSVSNTLAVGTMLTNTAIISTPFEVDPVDNVSVHGATVEEPYMDMLVIKWRDSGVPVAETNITYAIYYKNEGTIPAPNVILTDTLPEATSFVTSTTWWGEPVAPIAATDEYVTWDLDTMDPGEQDWLKVTIHISDGVPVGTTITNTVEIATSDEETDYDNNLNREILTTVDPDPDLTVRKYFREGAFIPGGEVSYGIDYYNEGGSPVTNVLITDTLPVATAFITSTQWGLPITPITVTDEYVIWDMGTVEPLDYQGEIYVYMQISDTVAAGTILTNTVELQGDQEESDYTDNVSSHSADIETPSRDLSVYKWLDEGAPVAGQLITYTVYVDNEGNFPASNVVVTDTLPLPTSYISDYNYSGFTTVVTGNTVVWTKDSLSGDSSAWLYLIGYISDTVPIGTVLTNTVQVSTSDEETDYTDNVYIDTLTTIDPRADMRVYKNALGGVSPGGSFTYELVYQNAGGSPAANVVITDTLPEGTVYLACLDCLPPTVEGNQLVWDLDTVPPSQGYYWLGAVMVEVSETVAPGTVLTNVIEVSTTSEESDYTNNVYNLAITVPEPFSKTASILVVLDYGGYDTGWFASYYTGALDALGCPYDVWDTGLRGDIDSTTLNQYTDGAVVWAVPEWGYVTDSWSSSQANLQSYLDLGGKLSISGQDIGYYSGGSTFFSDYLHATFVQDDTDLYGLNGVSGDPISDGLYLGISGGDGANNQYFPSEIDPIAPAVTIFTYDPSATMASDEPTSKKEVRAKPERGLEEPYPAEAGKHKKPKGGVELQGVVSSGTGAIRVDTGTYQVVYFAFGFEGINSQSDRELVMERVLVSLGGVLPRPTQLSPADGSEVAPGDVTYTWTSVAGASGYQIQIDTADTFDSPALISDTVSTTSYTATLTLGTWYWRVRALPDGLWTTAWELRIAEALVQTGKRIQIPRIDEGEGWDTRIQIQNVGDGPTGVITLFWGDHSDVCPPSDPGPVAYLCHRIPGNWGVQAVTAEISATAKSAILYSVSDDFFQAACDAAGTIDSSEAWITWEDTYAYSGEPLAVTVDRLVSNGSSASGMYNGFSETMLGPGPGPSYEYFATNIMHGYDNFDSTITIQNSGDYPASIWLYYKEEDNCEFMTAQHVECLAPGEAIRIGPGPDADMPFPSPELDAPWLGSAYITSNVPLAIVVDRWDADATMLLTHAGFPYIDYGATTNYASLVYRDISGWDAEIHVQNLTQESEPTFVTVEFFDQSGDSILFVGDWVCRNGTHTWRLSDLEDLGVNFPFGYVGAAEIQSHDQIDYPGEGHDGEPIFAVVDIKKTKIWDPDLGIWRPTVAGEPQGGTYNAFTPQQVTGVTTFALPLISKQSQATSRIAIRNNSNCNKFWGKIWIWDETGTSVGVIDVPWLHPKHMKIVDLAYPGWLPAGFVGAATFEVLEVEQLCDTDGDGYVDDEPIIPSVVVLNYDDDPDGSASGYEAFPIKDGSVVVVVVEMTPSSPVKAEMVEFEATFFPEQMNTAVAPTVTISIDAPYTDYTIAPRTGAGYTNGYLDSDPTKWYGTYTFTDTMGDGVYHISIAGAEDSFGNPVATDTRNMFILDTTPPSSLVTDLPTYQSTLSFPVSWSGSDATSGIAVYDVQYRDGAGSWTDWLTETINISDTFTGEDGHTYYFQSRARDNAGNVEDYPGGDGDTHLCVLFGDFDPNGLVDLADIMEVVSRWRMTDEDTDWDPLYDLNGDGIITVVDIMLVVAHWGETCE